MYAVRGATTVDADSKLEINEAAKELILKIIQKNEISIDDIISIIFTCTRDLKSAYPAEAARELGIKYAGLLCLQEMYVENSLERCIRMMVQVNEEKSQNDVKHIYLKNAVNLRRDLLQEF
jgi:monofunctional chorismate mutase